MEERVCNNILFCRNLKHIYIKYNLCINTTTRCVSTSKTPPRYIINVSKEHPGVKVDFDHVVRRRLSYFICINK